MSRSTFPTSIALTVYGRSTRRSPARVVRTALTEDGVAATIDGLVARLLDGA